MTHCAAPPTAPEPAAALMKSHHAWYLHVATRPLRYWSACTTR